MLGRLKPAKKSEVTCLGCAPETEGAALEAELDILDLVASAAKRPNLGRRAGYDNVRVRSLTKWHKRISYFVSDDEIKVLSMKDARQNV